jgi:hypothetical protein
MAKSRRNAYNEFDEIDKKSINEDDEVTDISDIPENKVVPESNVPNGSFYRDEENWWRIVGSKKKYLTFDDLCEDYPELNI